MPVIINETREIKMDNFRDETEICDVWVLYPHSGVLTFVQIPDSLVV